MAVSVHYEVTVENPHAHLFAVRCTVYEPNRRGQLFRLPGWIRGSYLVRDFAKHVQDLRVDSGDEPIAFERVDKRSFRSMPCRNELTVSYRVYAYDESVRKAWLDARRGFFNGSSLFYRPVGADADGYELTVRAPALRDWHLATAATPVVVDERGFGRYRCADYEELIDHPFELGPFTRVPFDVDGIPHEYVLSGRVEHADTARLARDTTAICREQRALFGGEPKLDRYLFLTHAIGAGYGGLEHRASTALVCARDDLPRATEPALTRPYRTFLGLVSHEYFHLWNVKRITARSFQQSDLGEPAYTRDLWHYEGVTSYYDDLVLRRAGVIDAPTYLDLVAEAATRLERTPGRARHTLADASFETWIKYYQPDEDAPNSQVNYYVKGSLAALCLDLTLRARSTVTLDDVMRALWTRYGATGEGVPEGGLEETAQQVSGLDLRAEFDHWLRSTAELPLAELLAQFGVRAERRASAGDGDNGGRISNARAPRAWHGARLRPGDTVVAYVLADSPAQRAGLAAGDQLVSIDGLRVAWMTWAVRQSQLEPERDHEVHFFRGDELMRATLKPVAPPADTWTLLLAEADPPALERRKAWLGA